MATPSNDTAGVITFPPLIALAALMVGLALDWLVPIGVLKQGPFLLRLGLGVLLIAFGAAIAVMAERTLRGIGTNINPFQPTLKLAREGIFARLRNPMYVGLTFILLGLAVALGSDWTVLLMIPALLTLHYGVVRREERYLERKFGRDYLDYKARVPRYGLPF